MNLCLKLRPQDQRIILEVIQIWVLLSQARLVLLPVLVKICSIQRNLLTMNFKLKHTLEDGSSSDNRYYL